MSRLTDLNPILDLSFREPSVAPAMGLLLLDVAPRFQSAYEHPGRILSKNSASWSSSARGDLYYVYNATHQLLFSIRPKYAETVAFNATRLERENTGRAWLCP